MAVGAWGMVTATSIPVASFTRHAQPVIGWQGPFTENRRLVKMRVAYFGCFIRVPEPSPRTATGRYVVCVGREHVQPNGGRRRRCDARVDLVLSNTPANDRAAPNGSDVRALQGDTP